LCRAHCMQTRHTALACAPKRFSTYMPPPDAAEKSAVPTIDPDDPIFQRIVELAGLPDNYFG
jgi:hypothetical protein